MGRFSLRLPESLHRQLEMMAEVEGIALNQYIIYALAQHSATAYQVTTTSCKDRTKQQAAFNSLLDRLGEPSTSEEFDIILGEGEPSQLESNAAQDILTRAKQLLSKVPA